jgi:hypothetical protein
VGEWLERWRAEICRGRRCSINGRILVAVGSRTGLGSWGVLADILKPYLELLGVLRGFGV